MRAPQPLCSVSAWSLRALSSCARLARPTVARHPPCGSPCPCSCCGVALAVLRRMVDSLVDSRRMAFKLLTLHSNFLLQADPLRQFKRLM